MTAYYCLAAVVLVGTPLIVAAAYWSDRAARELRLPDNWRDLDDWRGYELPCPELPPVPEWYAKVRREQLAAIRASLPPMPEPERTNLASAIMQEQVTVRRWRSAKVRELEAWPVRLRALPPDVLTSDDWREWRADDAPGYRER